MVSIGSMRNTLIILTVILVITQLLVRRSSTTTNSYFEVKWNNEEQQVPKVVVEDELDESEEISSDLDEDNSSVEREELITYKSKHYGTEFCVIPRVVSSHKRDGTITMLLHSSANYFGENLLRTVDKWDGKVSLAVLASSVLNSDNSSVPTVENTIHRMKKMASCHGFLGEALNAHVYFTRNKQEDKCPTVTLDSSKQLQSCDDLNTPLSRFRYNTWFKTYPVNVGRNIARKFDDSEYILFADMEQEYSVGAEAKLRNLTRALKIKEKKWLLTVRRFEYREDHPAPRTVDELREGYLKWVYVFHAFFWLKGHAIAGLKEWLNHSEELLVVDIKTKRFSNWEPMIVAHRSIPWHIEGIPYGRDNHVALALHLCCAGYTFPIAPDVFNVHAGVSKKALNRHLTQRINKIADRELIKMYHSLKEQYPDTAKACLKGRYPADPVNATLTI